MKHMKGKSLAALGLAAGYILGSRAGRGPYQKVKNTMSRVRDNPRVQEAAQTVEEAAKTRAQTTAEGLKHAAHSTAENVSSKIAAVKDSAE